MAATRNAKVAAKLAAIASELRPPPSASARYYNRELSWLQFNHRVLEESHNRNNPIQERLRFLSIAASNLDEFFMVRAAGLMGQHKAGVGTRSIDGLTPHQQIQRINEFTASLARDMHECWRSLRHELEAIEIHLIEREGLSRDEIEWLNETFMRSMFAVLTPLNIDPAHPFPFIHNKGLTLVVGMRNAEGKDMNGLIPIPAQLPRFVRLPDTDDGRNFRFVSIETVIGLCLHELFPSLKQPTPLGSFRVLRDSDIEYEEEAEDLTIAYEALLRRRRRGDVIRLEIEERMPPALRRIVISELEVPDEQVIVSDGLPGLSDLSGLIVEELPEHLFEKFVPRFPERVEEHNGDVFAAIRAKDFIVHHPYESFEVVLRYLRQAVRDPQVMAIKWTLYRTSGENSPIVEALKEAAELGKSVTAVIELKARFDETTNIQLARDMEKAGVHVVYGFQQLKTHAKLGLIVRREGGNMATYCHVGTGNYHPVTARIYTDLSYFTDDPVIGNDVARVFNYVTGYGRPEKLEELAASPDGIRRRIVAHIDAEIAHARAGRPAAIWWKLNSLVDRAIIDKLYEASSAGVEIDLIVRGICCLRPGIEGLSENIRVKSLIGRFLEHARIYCFGEGEALPSRQAAVYISSADLMERNLDRRVEVMVPLKNPTVHAQVLDQIMAANLKDNEQSWQLLPNGSALRIEAAAGEPAFNAHAYFMTNPSLSGRGQALEQHRPSELQASRTERL